MNYQESKYPYKWTLKNAKFTKDKGTVFSCFACGGGSTMGYKLAGFDVIGMNEIDPRMAKCYIENHNPKYSFVEPIQEFKNRKDLPKELYNLDILDGSPPCSSFSMAGNRSKDWGKNKKFREGQAKQVLDTLFFDFIDLAKKLKPKVVVAENVKGMLMGAAKEYVIKIHKAFEKAGYYCQHFLLDASKMGVPQKRERVFFICLRKDLSEPFLIQKDMFTQVPELSLKFNQKPIVFKEIKAKKGLHKKTSRQNLILKHFKNGDNSISDINIRVFNKNSGFNARIEYDNKVLSTIDSKSEKYRACDKLHVTPKTFLLGGSYPLDYNFLDSSLTYLVGMSVPPVMVANIADEIYKQWLSKL